MVVTKLRSFLGSNQAAADAAERRRDPRRKVLLSADVFPIEGYAEISVKNISRTGLAGETDGQVEAGEPLIFSIEGNRFHMGTVKWVRGRRFGLDLANALAIFGLENELDEGTALDHQPRARRHDVDITGRISLWSRRFRATVRDVSQSGMKLETGVTLPHNQQVIVRLRDRPLILASVQWGGQGKIGVRTAERIATLRLVYAYE